MFGIVIEEVSKVNSETGGFNLGHLWQLKKKLTGKRRNHTAAVLDKHGNRTINEGLETYQKEWEDLCEARLNAARKI